MATTYTFTLVPTWGSVGSFVRRGTGGTRNGTVTDPNGASVTVVQGGVSQAGFLLPDPSGVISFTTTDVPTVLVDFGAGPVTVNATNAVTANLTAAANAASSAASASSSASSAASSAALVGAPAGSAIAANLKGKGTISDVDYTSLENALADLAAGGVLEVSQAWSRSTTFTVNKACTLRFLKGASITTTANVAAITVAANDVFLDRPYCIGTSGTTFATGGRGISAVGVLGAPYTGLRIRAPKLRNFTQYGIYLEFCDSWLIETPDIDTIAYAGIMTISCNRGSIWRGQVKNITQPSGVTNSYGIAISYNEASGVAASPRPTNITVDGTVVDGVPNWEGIDTHAGIDIKVINCTVLNCKFGIAMVPGREVSTLTYAPTNVLVRGNTVDSGRTDGVQTYGIQVVGVSTGVGWQNNVAWATGVVTDNTVKFCGADASTGFALNLQDTSGVVVRGNTFDRPVAVAIRLDYNNRGAIISDNTATDCWATSAPITAMVYAQSGWNTATVTDNRLVRGSYSATLVNAGGLRIGSILGTVLTDANNDFSTATTAYTGLSGNGVLRFDNRGIKGGYVSALPTIGVWQQGAQLLSTVPAAAGSPGWVCTTAGGASSATWAATTAYSAAAWVKTSTGKVLECVVAGTSSGTEPNPTTIDGTVTDGTVTWVYRSATSAVFKAMPNVAA